MSDVEPFVDLLGELQRRGRDPVVADLCRQPGSLDARRKVALFVGGLRGHRLEVTDLLEQPYGYVGQCARCGMVVKVPRVVVGRGGVEGVFGRLVEFDCPSAAKGDAKELEGRYR